MAITHYLKTEKEYFEAVYWGRKKFELRINDRDFKVGDLIVLKETVSGVETGLKLPPLKIIYILQGGKYGLDKNYCIINW